MTTGQPTKYRSEYCQLLIDYFDVPPTKTSQVTRTNKDGSTKTYDVEVANDLPTLIGFAKKIGVSRDSVHQWGRDHKKFSDSIKKAKELQEENWRTCSLKGLYNPTFTIFMGKNVFKWTDKTQVEVGNIDEQSIKVSFEAAGKEDKQE